MEKAPILTSGVDVFSVRLPIWKRERRKKSFVKIFAIKSRRRSIFKRNFSWLPTAVADRSPPFSFVPSTVFSSPKDTAADTSKGTPPRTCVSFPLFFFLSSSSRRDIHTTHVGQARTHARTPACKRRQSGKGGRTEDTRDTAGNGEYTMQDLCDS